MFIREGGKKKKKDSDALIPPEEGFERGVVEGRREGIISAIHIQMHAPPYGF